ncbi:MAG: hypothetical protein ABIR83_07835, partial [Nakamurella sp.]
MSLYEPTTRDLYPADRTSAAGNSDATAGVDGAATPGPRRRWRRPLIAGAAAVVLVGAAVGGTLV